MVDTILRNRSFEQEQENQVLAFTLREIAEGEIFWNLQILIDRGIVKGISKVTAAVVIALRDPQYPAAKYYHAVFVDEEGIICMEKLPDLWRPPVIKKKD
ncbi:MAG: hypothetical protein WC858_05265 [Parcubacteria group bacterium]|jgi:hypothetical protein